MTDLIIKAFEGRYVRYVEIDGEPWFVAADVCAELDLDTTAIRKLDSDEKGLHSMQTPGGAQSIAIVSEGGLYTLTLRCRDAMVPGTKAYRFRKWVTGVLLPEIRRTGSYGKPQPELENPAWLRGALLTYTERVIALESQVHEQESKVAAYDSYMDSTGRFTLIEAAKALGQRPKKFPAQLEAGGFLYRLNSKPVPYQKWIDRGLFLLRVKEYNGKDRDQTFVTPRGMLYLAEWLRHQQGTLFLPGST
jgi:anti-repressor protein